MYNPQLYRLFIASGFDYLYDKVGMYDAMRDVVCHRRTTEAITWAWQQTDDIRQHMLYFLENHDEQRIASDFFAGDGRKGVPALVVNVLMQPNPFMLYAGQERGERGMDEEGFSGRDGRTTIFDYWSLDTFTRPLNDDEQQLQEMYQKVLNIARKEKTVSQGLTFDLMYMNRQYERQYAFLRAYGKELLLVVANFDDESVSIDLRLPAHAFDYMHIKEGDRKAVDLLSDKQRYVQLQRDGIVSVELPARGAVVYKI